MRTMMLANGIIFAENLVKAENFNELVNMAITQEDCISAHRAEKKRKTPTGPSATQPARYRLVQNAATRAPPRSNMPGRWVARPPSRHDSIDHRHHNFSSNNNRVHGRVFRQSTKETTTIVVSIAEARPTLSRIALNLGNLSKGKHPIQPARARARGRWSRSAREG
jgi:hypothetical protein